MKKTNPKLAAKYFPRKKEKEIDTAREDRSLGKNHAVLMDAFRAWTGLDRFRKMAERNKMYTFSDQWGDKIYDPNTRKTITERQHILDQGNVPLQNNRIRGIVRSVSGVFQSTQTEPVCVSRDRDEQAKGEMMSKTIQYVYQLNRLWGLDGACFMNFLVNGVGAFKSSYGWRNGKMDVWTDLVNVNRMFFDNHMEDPRHWDCHLIGEIHDVGLYDVIAQFSDSPEKAEWIRDIYSSCGDEDTVVEYIENLMEGISKYRDFFISDDRTRCRVIEVWKKESKERYLYHDWLTGEYGKVDKEGLPALVAENRSRMAEQSANGVSQEDMRLIEYKWFVDNYWYFYFMSPRGDVLMEGETPFWHESHPYSLKVYTFFDGQVFPFVSDFIDQQRYINRMITLDDFVRRASAKGVLLVPEDAIPSNMTVEDFAEEWTRFNGVIAYKAKPGVAAPQQVVTSSSQLGLNDMLSIQLKLLEDISGVQGALQGRSPQSGTAASLYAQQVQNSTTSLTEIFEAFRELRENRDEKNMKLIQQFYDEPRYINISGSDSRPDSMLYNPDVVRNSEFDLSITESTSTPAYRMVMNDFLMQLFSAQQISLEELLENGAFPFADKLLQSISARKHEAEKAQAAMMAGGQMPAGEQGGLVPEDVRQAVSQGTSPMVQRMLDGYSNME